MGGVHMHSLGSELAAQNVAPPAVHLLLQPHARRREREAVGPEHGHKLGCLPPNGAKCDGVGPGACWASGVVSEVFEQTRVLLHLFKKGLFPCLGFHNVKCKVHVAAQDWSSGELSTCKAVKIT